MKKIYSLILTFFVMIMLCSCGYSHQVNEMAYVVGLGIDKGIDKNICLSLQFAKPVAKSSSGAESEDKEKSEKKNSNTTVISAEEDDIFSAISILERSLSKQINLTHTKILIFSEQIAREGILKFVENLIQNNQFRPNTFAAVCQGSAKEYFEKTNPLLEQNPAKYYTLMFSKDTKSTVPDVTLLDLYFDISGSGKNAVLPMLEVVNEENKTKTNAMAVFSKDKLIENLSENDAQTYNILTGGFRDGYFDIKKDENLFCVRLKAKKPKIKIKRDGNKLNAAIKIKAYVDPLSFEGTENELEAITNEEIEKKIKEFIEKNKEIMCDTIGFGNILKRTFLTYDDFVNFDYMQKFQNISANVTVKTKSGSSLLKR